MEKYCFESNKRICVFFQVTVTEDLVEAVYLMEVRIKKLNHAKLLVVNIINNS